MAIFKKKTTKRAFVCGYCGHSIDKDNEPNGEIKKVDGKPACAVCRATKLSKLSDLIKADKIKYETDKHILEEKSEAEAMQDIKEIAYASQQNAKKYLRRLSPKKFLK